MRFRGITPVSPLSSPRSTWSAARARTLRSSLALLVPAALALGCGEDSPTGVDSHATPGPEPVGTAGTTNGQGTPEGSGVLTDATFPAVVCGIPVTVSIFEAGVEFEPASPDGSETPGHPPSEESGVIKITYTANGNAVQQMGAGRVTRTAGPVREDGTFEGVQTVVGLQQLSRVGGETLMKETGKLIIRLVVLDAPGFPILSAEFEVVGGTFSPPGIPAVFCSILTEELT